MEHIKYPNKLREIRKAKGLKQIDLSAALGFACEDRICRWERGQSVPHITNLVKICKFYQVTLDEIYPEL